MDEQNTKAQEAYKAMLEAHDAEVAANKMAELLRLLNPHLVSLKTIARALAQTISHIETRLKVIPDPTTTKRKRAATRASEQQVDGVRAMFKNLPEGELVTVHDIERALGYGPRYAADACHQLEQQGWIKSHGTSGYAFIPEQEAARENGFNREELENGPVMIDDIKERDDV